MAHELFPLVEKRSRLRPVTKALQKMFGGKNHRRCVFGLSLGGNRRCANKVESGKSGEAGPKDRPVFFSVPNEIRVLSNICVPKRSWTRYMQCCNKHGQPFPAMPLSINNLAVSPSLHDVEAPRDATKLEWTSDKLGMERVQLTASKRSDGRDANAFVVHKEICGGSGKSAYVDILRKGKELLVFPGPGGYKIEWSPGTKLLPMVPAPSGHLVVPCDRFSELPAKAATSQISFVTDHTVMQ